MKGKRTSTFVMIAIVAVLMTVAVVLINQTTIFQEGNPIPVWRGVWQLQSADVPYAQIKDEPATFLTKTGLHSELFAHIEATYLVEFQERLEDDVYLFQGEDGQLKVDARQYSRYYQIWEVKDGGEEAR